MTPWFVSYYFTLLVFAKLEKYLLDQHSEVVTTKAFLFIYFLNPVTSLQCRGTDAVIESSCPSIGRICKEAEPSHRLVGRKGLDVAVAGGVVGWSRSAK